MNKITAYTFGQSDVQLSALSLGTVKFGRNSGVKYPSAFDLPDDKAIGELLAVARDYGVTSLDTAPAYGLAEQRLGQLLSYRHDWQIISKAGETFDTRTGQSHYDFSAKALRLSLENTLRLLKTDYLDIWLLHSDGNDLANLNDEVLSLLHQAKQQGLVRAIGASTKTIAGGEYALQHLDGIMMTASLKHEQEKSLFAIAEQHKKGLILKKIYDSGWALDSNQKNRVMQQTLHQLFLHKAVSSAVIGTITPQHLKENCLAWLNKDA